MTESNSSGKLPPVSCSERHELAERCRRIADALPPGAVRDAWLLAAEDLEVGAASDEAADALEMIKAHLAAVAMLKN